MLGIRWGVGGVGRRRGWTDDWRRTTRAGVELTDEDVGGFHSNPHTGPRMERLGLVAEEEGRATREGREGQGLALGGGVGADLRQQIGFAGTGGAGEKDVFSRLNGLEGTGLVYRQR